MIAPRTSPTIPDYDVVIVGGGFYGCSLALYLRSVTDKILVLEAESELLTRASRVNQARVHSGFHYPRSFVTASRSRKLQARFKSDFPDAIDNTFAMLYAIARNRSKISSNRFFKMFSDMGAQLESAGRIERALFNMDEIEDIFRCEEVAFNWLELRQHLRKRLDAAGIEVRFGTPVRKVVRAGATLVVKTETAAEIAANTVFNVTYGNLNSLLEKSNLGRLKLKHELAEVALMQPPDDLAGYGVTVMDGPFFSAMPFSSESLYSLTHVRYTPHYSWIDGGRDCSNYQYAAKYEKQTRWMHMVTDAARFLPCLREARYSESLFDVKTVLSKNERDDGRPILFHQHQDATGMYSVLGAKVDNIYDLFEVVRSAKAEWRGAHEGFLIKDV